MEPRDPGAPTTPHPVVGLLGLGRMGLPMALTLTRAGFDVIGWNRSAVVLPDPDPVVAEPDPQMMESGRGRLTVVQTVAEVARATMVISMLTDLPPLLPLVFGESRAEGSAAAYPLAATFAPLLVPGHAVEVIIVMSTCSPAAVVAFADDLAKRGVDLVDAPVSGGVGGAARGTLSIMVGVTPGVLARVRPVLDALAQRVTHFGPVGSGSVAKACNQLVVNTTVASLAEAVLLAERSGLDVPLLLEALSSGLGSSAVLEWKRDAFVHNDFRPSGPVRLAVKDLGFATAAGAAAGAELPVGTAALQVFAEAATAGLGDLDNAAVLEHLRRRSS